MEKHPSTRRCIFFARIMQNVFLIRASIRLCDMEIKLDKQLECQKLSLISSQRRQQDIIKLFPFMKIAATRRCIVMISSETQADLIFRCYMYHEQKGPFISGAPVAQWVKRWPIDLADRVRSSPEVKSFNRKRSFIAHSLSLSSEHRPDITGMLLKRT